MKQSKRLAIVTTHPIQYNAPLFKCMNEESRAFTIKVFYTIGQWKEKTFDKDFGMSIDWDIPLLEGYNYTFVKNTSGNPGSRQFKGIINPTLHTEIQEWEADAILVFGWSFSSHLKAIRYFNGKIPVLFRGDSTLIDELPTLSLKKLARRLFLKWVYRHIDYALYVGFANREYFIAHGLKPAQLIFAPHAIDKSRFASNHDADTAKAKSWRLSLGISENNIVFLFAGKLTIKKDPELLIRSFLSLNDGGTSLIIIGTGELEIELKEKYKRYKQIVFIDFQNQSVMPVVYRMADVFVLPSRGPGETWGLAVNEAMACGRAVIASDKCGCSVDLIHVGNNGYVFKPGDIESLAGCMRQVSKNFKEFGINSRKIIEDWSYTKTVQQLNILFEKGMINEAG